MKTHSFTTKRAEKCVQIIFDNVAYLWKFTIEPYTWAFIFTLFYYLIAPIGTISLFTKMVKEDGDSYASISTEVNNTWIYYYLLLEKN